VLIVKDGPQAGERFEIGDGVLIGRENATCVIDDEEVSRRHALIRAIGDRIVVEDCGSTNGTWVNGARIEAPTALNASDVVRVGQTTFALELRTERTKASSSPAGVSPARPPSSQEFAPPAGYKRSRIATRDIRVEVITIAIIVATAAALIAYFAAR
jgi:pSer/pThr/pTyr-binding forkhead associated (FHA) protein